MRVTSPIRSLALASAICAATVALPYAQQAADAVTVPFSDPARPGAIRVAMHSGGIVVKGGNRRDVIVTSRGEDNNRRRSSETPTGLRRISQSAGLVITEENNQMTVSGGSPNRQIDVELQVPTRVSLKLSAHNDGDIVVENVEGDIETTNHNGAIRLTNIAGSVVANTHNEDVRVTLTRIATEKAMSFISHNGDVDVTLPASAKANLKMRSDNGEIFTDFDMQLRPAAAPQTTTRGRGTRVEINQSIYGAINGGGPEFELRSYNGNIYVRKGGQ